MALLSEMQAVARMDPEGGVVSGTLMTWPKWCAKR